MFFFGGFVQDFILRVFLEGNCHYKLQLLYNGDSIIFECEQLTSCLLKLRGEVLIGCILRSVY